MSNSHIEMGPQFAFLSALTPGHIDRDAVARWFGEFSGNDLFQFEPSVIFDTECYRAEILENVDKILKKYAGHSNNQASDNLDHATHELKWAILQLWVDLRAAEQEIGVQIDPKAHCVHTHKKLQHAIRLLGEYCLGEDNSKLQALANKNFAEDSTETTLRNFIQFIDDRNNTRLFWVWGRPNLDLVLQIAGQTEAKQRLDDTTYWPGQISWALYALRGSLFAAKLSYVYANDPQWLQGSNLTDEQKQAYRNKHREAYWHVYKYRLLNDFVWGMINLACFEWLYGAGIYGWFGDFATCILLGMDIYLSSLALVEETAKYQTIRDKYIKEGRAIIDKIKADNVLSVEWSGSDSDILTWIATYTSSGNDGDDLIEWQQAFQDFSDRWQTKQTLLRFDLGYSVALGAAFVLCAGLLIGGFLPLAVAAFLTEFGTVLCLALTIGYRTWRALISIQQVKTEHAKLEAQQAKMLDEFLRLKTDGNSEEDLNSLYIDMVKNAWAMQDLSGSITQQYWELARTTLLRLLVPILIGLTLVFAPATLLMVPTYVFTLAASALLAYGLEMMIPKSEVTKLQEGNIDWQPVIQNGNGFFNNPPKSFGQNARDVMRPVYFGQNSGDQVASG